MTPIQKNLLKVLEAEERQLELTRRSVVILSNARRTALESCKSGELSKIDYLFVFKFLTHAIEYLMHREYEALVKWKRFEN